jgi:hypothetical protein
MNASPSTNRNLIWLAVAVPIFLCALTIIASTSVGAAYIFTQSETTGATASAVFALNAQRRLTQTAVQIKAQEERLTQTAAAVIRKTEVAVATATATQATEVTQSTPTPTATATAVFVGGGIVTGKATVIFKECRGKEGSVQLGNNPPQSLHAFKSVTYTDITSGKYYLKVDFPGERALNFEGEIEIRPGTQVIPFGDQCKD